MLCRRLLGAIAVGIFTLGAAAAYAATPAATCKDAKGKGAGKYVLGTAKAYGKNIKTVNLTKLGTDLSKAHSKITKAFTKAEYSGSGASKGCDTLDDVDVIKDKADMLVEDTLDEVDPSATTTTTTTSTTTTTLPLCGNALIDPGEECDGANPGICPGGAGCFGPGPNECECQPAMCDAIDVNSGGVAASGTFSATNAGAPQAGVTYCGGTSAANKFGTCPAGVGVAGDAQCGGTAGACQPIPWLGVGSFAPFPITSVSVTFTAGLPDAKCVHPATIACGATVAPCPSTPALTAACTGPGVPNTCCTGPGAGCGCCAAPGFAVATFFIPALGFCSHVDQTSCGSGIVDTSVPMLGDNDVSKVADTTTPTGPGCTYVVGNVHPVCAATEDTSGQILTTIGNGGFDAPGGHTRFTIPQRSTTWLETVSPPCTGVDTFDVGDLPITNFNLRLAPTTASATAAYVDSAADGDLIAFCGAGPASFGAPAVGAPDLPGLGSLTAAVGTALSGGGPLYDLTFSALTPLTSPVLAAPVAACVPLPPGCPE